MSLHIKPYDFGGHSHATYIDYRPDGSPFYVGKGDEKRVNLIARGNNRHHKHTIQKYECFRLTVFYGTEQECLDEEKRLIALYGRRDLGAGILVNMTDGGEGLSNPSVETRKKLSEIAIAQNAAISADQVKSAERSKRLSEIMTATQAAIAADPAKSAERSEYTKLGGKISGRIVMSKINSDPETAKRIAENNPDNQRLQTICELVSVPRKAFCKTTNQIFDSFAAAKTSGAFLGNEIRNRTFLRKQWHAGNKTATVTDDAGKVWKLAA